MTERSDEEQFRLRDGLLQAVRDGLEAPRNSASKWDSLYEWFATELAVGDGARGGPVIGKVITERRQVGNRLDEMAKSDPKYAVISVLNGLDPQVVIDAMTKRKRLPSLRVALFLAEETPARLVEFND